MKLKLETITTDNATSIDILTLDGCHEELAEQDEAKVQVVELTFFVSLTVAETAMALGLDRRTVEEHWTLARTWLRANLAGPERD